jgi:peptidoglycan/LPS O-acetylase OafA/YrhL
MPFKRAYFPQLDGLRAIAVILVLLVHSNFFVFNTGWIGVPIFFVLSGFLITGILLEHKQSEHYFKTFYFRRVLRIFPIYYLVLFFCLAWSLAIHCDVSQFWYFAFYLQSFSISQGLKPEFCNNLMGHTWSLSVEELFYLAWPAIIYVMNRKVLGWLCVFICVFSFSYKLYQVGYGTEAQALLSAPGNLDCLMAGALLYLYASHPTGQEIRSLHKLLFALLLVLTFFFIGSQYFPLEKQATFLCKIGLSICVSWLSFFVILFLISAHHPAPVAEKFFTNKALVYLGKISYGIYLYHIPVYRFTDSFLYHYQIALNPILVFTVKLLITYLVSACSWRFIEKPLLSFKTKLIY